MKKIKINIYTFFTLLTVCSTAISCSSDDELTREERGNSSDLSCYAVGKEFVTESSRSSLNYSETEGMKFAWTTGDEMTVFAKDDDRARQLYMLDAGDGKPTARFHTDNFRLKEGQLYYSFSKTESNNTHVSIPDQNNISVDYSGQEQKGNACSSHLGDYDFMASGTLCKDETFAFFDFNHLGATLRVDMTLPTSLPEGVKFTEMELYNSDNSFRQPKRDFSFAAGTDGMSYTFKWPEQNIESMDRFKLTLLNATGTEEGVAPSDNHVDGTSNNGHLICYIEIPPADFSQNKLAVMLKGKTTGGEAVSYVGTWTTSKNVLAGKAYKVNVTMEEPNDFKVTLKVNHNWQHGNTLDQSRGTGDPGEKDDIATPTYIYYIYCHDGKVIKPTTAQDAAVVTTISGLTENNWETKNSDGNWVSTYKGKGNTDNGIISLQKPQCSTPGHDCSYHLYVVASTSALTITAAENASEQDVVRELKYSLPDSDVQVFMRDLYSSPWDESNFVGDLKDPMQDVTLYHVAAKVDLKWNSTSAIENVSVNSVKNEGLYIFKPTENAYATGSYTETQTMDVDQQYNGRYVFYLPQFTNNCTYKVKLGGNEAENITFTPATTGGFTSWLRWLKKN